MTILHSAVRIIPGRNEINTTQVVDISFLDEDDTLTNPTTVTFKTRSPCGTETTYVYGTDGEVTRSSTGIYRAAVAPDEGGRWAYRWETTGPVYVKAGTFLVQASPFSAFNDTWWTGGFWYW